MVILWHFDSAEGLLDSFALGYHGTCEEPHDDAVQNDAWISVLRCIFKVP